jgi:hypothetical protein
MSFGKNINIRKRTIELDEKELFCELVDMYEGLAIRSEKAFTEFGINLQSYEEEFFLTIENLFYLKYGEWKTSIITWYIWERKDIETDEIGVLEWTNEDTDEKHEVILKCSEDLWDILNEIEGKTK